MDLNNPTTYTIVVGCNGCSTITKLVILVVTSMTPVAMIMQSLPGRIIQVVTSMTPLSGRIIQVAMVIRSNCSDYKIIFGVKAGCKRQAARGRLQEAGCKRQAARGRQQAGCKRQAARGKLQEAGCKRQAARGRQQEAGSKRQAARGRLQEAG